jgi:hypothetical protein
MYAQTLTHEELALNRRVIFPDVFTVSCRQYMRYSSPQLCSVVFRGRWSFAIVLVVIHNDISATVNAPQSIDIRAHMACRDCNPNLRPMT